MKGIPSHHRHERENDQPSYENRFPEGKPKFGFAIILYCEEVEHTGQMGFASV